MDIKVIALVRNYKEEHDYLSIDDCYYISDLDFPAPDLSDIIWKH